MVFENVSHRYRTYRSDAKARIAGIAPCWLILLAGRLAKKRARNLPHTFPRVQYLLVGEVAALN
jgi:hypothetical protein